jgi:hypothetical protein
MAASIIPIQIIAPSRPNIGSARYSRSKPDAVAHIAAVAGQARDGCAFGLARDQWGDCIDMV